MEGAKLMVQMSSVENGAEQGDKPGCKHLEGTIGDLLEREWLITNGLGGYASGTVAGCPTRRYHGLLIWSRMPPLQRYAMLSSTLDRLVTAQGDSIDLSTFEFPGALHPQGYTHLVDFDYEIAPPEPWVRFTWMVGNVKIIKRIRLVYQEPHCTITYEILPQTGGLHRFMVKPLLAMRDFHALRRKPSGNPFESQVMPNAVYSRCVQDPQVTLCLAATGPMAQQTQFSQAEDWWYNFLYRKEAERQMDCGEDLYAPGWFSIQGEGPLVLQITAVPGVENVVEGARRAWKTPRQQGAESWRISGPREAKSLCRAAQQFVVERRTAAGPSMQTILAGYPWFGDWGRDTAIAIPGILLSTGRYDEARDVLTTFAEHQQNGLIPNVFDDRGQGCAYNSVDASLWFVRVVEQLAEATRDTALWQGKLGRAVCNVVDSFIAGTEYDIRAQEDGLLWCGNEDTQLTWMDAKYNNHAVTPRHGMPVEVNALWVHALSVAARHAAGSKRDRAGQWSLLARKARQRFSETFWYAEGGYLYDIVRGDFRDTSLRPNQAIALALPDCPLPLDQQRRALQAVQDKLLTPFGLRTLSPDHPDYRGRYEGDWGARDGAYHQGTVWPWLIGPFLEAYLRLNEHSDAARLQARTWLNPLLHHLECDACLGSISEIFDGDAPHKPRGCVAQAWSVSEVLRVLLMVIPNDPAHRGSNGYFTRRVLAGLPAGLFL
jgi:predicted glycogen debranching enzyme